MDNVQDLICGMSYVNPRLEDNFIDMTIAKFDPVSNGGCIGNRYREVGGNIDVADGIWGVD